ncbi:poly(ADP-ribose) glycohydrolase-like [Clytia hemisphaerica]|uniref:poly(ADP-ribose) glycohydrolase n=1 Tax=Clytia hemisphaerica TaxID=252671 RepID=A0A7M5V1I2_9CNID
MSVPIQTNHWNSYTAYDVNYWPSLKESLTILKENPTLKDLKELILKYLNKTKLYGPQYAATSGSSSRDIPDQKDLKTLATVISQEEKGFIEEIIPKICDIALQLEDLFPDGELKILEQTTNQEISFNRLQVACLVSHMFFCTFLPCEKLKYSYEGHFCGDVSPTGPITFRYWHTTLQKPTILYMKSLFNYFKDICNTPIEQLKSQTITYSRKNLDFNESPEPIWECSEKRIITVNSHLTGSIGDHGSHVEMDFANANVGFGTTGTQEEIILGTSPESCPIVLFNERLKQTEAILIQGAKRYASFEGYGFSVKYTGPFVEDGRDWTKRQILAMDALWGPGDEGRQLRDVFLKRELNKAYCAFSMVAGEIVDSGHWGCGAFGGNKGIKSILQIMAASDADLKSLEFYCFKEKDFHNVFSTVLKLIKEKNLMVGDLWKLFKKYGKSGVANSDLGFLNFLKNDLSKL